MPSHLEEKKIASVNVAVAPSLRQWLETRAKADERSLSGQVRHLLMGLYHADMKQTGLAKDLIAWEGSAMKAPDRQELLKFVGFMEA